MSHVAAPAGRVGYGISWTAGVSPQAITDCLRIRSSTQDIVVRVSRKRAQLTKIVPGRWWGRGGLLSGAALLLVMFNTGHSLALGEMLGESL